ncbi:hypothetical protein LX36DRAFT_258036 [Colletotrichum falcatum]|nr:hypothetical protein LX36DRAFT_258036 [Colletotrichum falcatum]
MIDGRWRALLLMPSGRSRKFAIFFLAWRCRLSASSPPPHFAFPSPLFSLPCAPPSIRPFIHPSILYQARCQARHSNEILACKTRLTWCSLSVCLGLFLRRASLGWTDPVSFFSLLFPSRVLFYFIFSVMFMFIFSIFGFLLIYFLFLFNISSWSFPQSVSQSLGGPLRLPPSSAHPSSPPQRKGPGQSPVLLVQARRPFLPLFLSFSLSLSLSLSLAFRHTPPQARRQCPPRPTPPQRTTSAKSGCSTC